MITRRLNPAHSGGEPESVGDRYYASEQIRDMDYALDRAGSAFADIAQTVNRKVIVSGGRVTRGTGDTINISACVARAPVAITVPSGFGAFPFPTTSEDCEMAQISLPAQVNLAIAGATLDGVAINYVKLSFAYANGNTRNRSDAGGSYVADVTRSFTLTIDATPPTAYQVLLSTIIGLPAGVWQIRDSSSNAAASERTERLAGLSTIVQAEHVIGVCKDPDFRNGWWLGANQTVIDDTAGGLTDSTIKLQGIGATVDTIYRPMNRQPAFVVPHFDGQKYHWLVRARRDAAYNGNLVAAVELFDSSLVSIVTYSFTISLANLTVAPKWFSFAIDTSTTPLAFGARFYWRTPSGATAGNVFISKTQITSRFCVPYSIARIIHPAIQNMATNSSRAYFPLDPNDPVTVSVGTSSFTVPNSSLFANQLEAFIVFYNLANNQKVLFGSDGAGTSTAGGFNVAAGGNIISSIVVPVIGYTAAGSATVFRDTTAAVSVMDITTWMF